MAGRPSYAELGRLSRHLRGQVQPSGLQVEPLAASTAHEILTGRRSGPPRWRWIASFVTVLRAAAARSGVNPDSIGTLEEWKAKHEAVCGAHRAARQLAHTGPDTNSMLCNVAPELNVSSVSQQPMIGIADEDQENLKRAAILDLINPVGGEWWGDYHDVVPAWFTTRLRLEAAASLIRTYESGTVPGLLQTREYASAIMRLSLDRASAKTRRRRVDVRMRRQKILRWPNQVKLWAIIDEAVLRRRIGDDGTMRRQIEHLIAMAEYPNISIQVLPQDSSMRAASAGPISMIRLPGRHFPDVVYLEQLTSALYLFKPDDVQHYSRVLDSLAIEATSPSSTPALLREILDRD